MRRWIKTNGELNVALIFFLHDNAYSRQRRVNKGAYTHTILLFCVERWKKGIWKYEENNFHSLHEQRNAFVESRLWLQIN